MIRSQTAGSFTPQDLRAGIADDCYGVNGSMPLLVPALLAFTTRQLDDDDVRDICAEAGVRALRAVANAGFKTRIVQKDGTVRPSSLRPWLKAILRNVERDAARRAVARHEIFRTLSNRQEIARLEKELNHARAIGRTPRKSVISPSASAPGLMLSGA
jgi:DNA-directed RNA polymerase specialized sigma24 family protein